MIFPATALLSLTLASEAMVTVGLTWEVLKLGGSTAVLGAFIFLTSCLPFVLQKVFEKTRAKEWIKDLNENPDLAFARIRVLGICIAIAAALMHRYLKVWHLYLLTSAFTVVIFFSNRALESCFSLKVLAQKISGNLASRLLQTAVQVGAFLGAAAGGFLVDRFGFLGLSLGLIFTFAIGSFAFRFLDWIQGDLSLPEQANVSSKRVHLPLQLCFTNIALVTFGIWAFNILVPILAQRERHWSGTEFGILDSFAGLGAVLVLFYLKEKRIRWSLFFISAIGLGLSETAIGVVPWYTLVCLSGFAAGWFGNCIRVHSRQTIYSYVQNPAEGGRYAEILSWINLASRSLIPLILGFVTTEVSASKLIVTVGGILLMGLLLIYSYSYLRPSK